ncbi:phosphopantetheine-binding protein [Paenibacillus sp. FSL K6-1096]|uniref:acyl carrier protein n=1 Tax=Paenibacillus sp. FSL K6-1096 TaxID=2921460 RepID=UPI0030EC20CF
MDNHKPKDDVENMLYEMITTLCGKPKDVHNNSSLVNDLSLSSLEIVQLIVMIEEKFNVEIDMNVEFKVIQDIIDYINKEVGSNV